MSPVVQILRVLNYIFGAAVILIGVGAYVLGGAVIPLLLAVGLFAVGPFEDLLVRYLHLPGVDPGLLKALINQSTSLVLVLLLLAAILLSL